MPRYVAFLRAINVGGHTVRMDALCREFEGLGFRDVTTFIASGNVIFSTGSTAAGALERKIESRLASALGYEVATFLRTPDEVAAVAAYRPFPASLMSMARTTGALNVGFLAAPLPAASGPVLDALATDIDEFHVQGRELYWLCRRRQSGSKISNAVLERALKVRATFRGINTVERLAALTRPGGASAAKAGSARTTATPGKTGKKR